MHGCWRNVCSVAGCLSLLLLVGGCAGRRGSAFLPDELERFQVAYRQKQADALASAGKCSIGVGSVKSPGRLETAFLPPRDISTQNLTFGTFAGDEPATSQPVTGLPDDYWRDNLWDQAGTEFSSLVRRDFWRGFKTSFWDLENALALTATMGASVAIRETGVDDTIRRRIHGHRQLGDFDEPIQLLGNPGTHFAATGVLWLTSALTHDAEQHELAKTLTEALAVNGASTLLLKVAANTRAPDGGRYAWPSGHTSSAFTVAAVLNEYYGPWVGVPSLALAGLVGYQRLDSRVHDFSDVVFGAVLGYVVGTSIAQEDRARFPELWGMRLIPFSDPETGTTGLALWKSW